MDTNGTRFHQLYGHADWSRCAADAGIAVTDVLSLKPLLLRLPPNAGGAPADPVAGRRGADRDRYGNWYWVDPAQAKVLVQSSGTGTLSDFWPADLSGDPPPADAFAPADAANPTAPCRFGGLCVTEDHYLLVGTLDEPGLLVFDLHAGGPPRHIRWPQAVPFQPFDLSAATGGGAFVLDRANRRYWALDRHLGVIAPPAATPPPELFTPAAGGADDLRPPAVAFPPGNDLDLSASPLSAIEPVAIEALPDGTVLILDRTLPAVVHRYRLAQLMSTVTLDLSSVLPTPPAPGEQLFGADLAFVEGSDRAGDRVYVSSADGSQAYAFSPAWQDLPLALPPTGGGVNDAPFLPMRLFGSKALVAAGGSAWYDFDGRAFVPLVEQKRPRYVPDGTVETPIFDGREPGCVWHRLFLDGCLPPQTTVEVWSRTADVESEVARAPWAPEPSPRRRAGGSELPLLPSTNDLRGVFELLFQRARGRYLQLKLHLHGDGRTSPILHALRAWYPRFSYLDRYLPAVYREDVESASFLDRFLANLEGIFTSIEDKVAVARLLLDARTAPKEGLDWLAGWFGVALDPAWSEPRRRLFLRHAMDFFQMRGTTRGLIAALRLVVDDCADERIFTDDTLAAPASIRVLEWFRLRTQTALALGDPSAGAGIRAVSSPPAWTPEQGGAVLLVRYRQALAAAGVATPLSAFPVFEPADGTGPLWRQFVRDVLALSATATPADVAGWHQFLTARYATADQLNQAWHTHVADIDSVDLPSALPPDGAPLFDWYQFQLGGGRFVASGTRFIPSLGRAALQLRWQQAAGAAGLPAGDFPLSAPDDPTARTLWQGFAADTLGFVPSTGTREKTAWVDFLYRRYRRVAALNVAWGTGYSGFDDPTLALPTTLPPDGAPLVDWDDFFAIVMATRNNAHRFTVLLPVPARDAFDVSLHEQRRQLAKRIINLEKPAHTLFDVKYYWAMFRVGFARLDFDTLLDVGSRAPELLPSMVLDQGFLAESHLQGVPSERETERPVLGQHALRARTTAEKTA